MSNFVHKVKDAMTDHDKPATRSQATEDRTHGAGNPFTSNYNNRQNAPRMDNPVNTGPGRTVNRPDDGTGSLAPNAKSQADNEYTNYPTSTVTESQPSSYNRNPSSSMPGDSSSSASSADINAGPHSSKIANKLDPRVDSDLDNRANPNQAPIGTQRPTGNMGNMPAQQQQGYNQGRGMNQSNMPAQQQQQQQQPFTQGLGQGQGKGMDSHTSTEDNFNKSTQEHHSQQQPGFNPNIGQQMGGNQEEDFSTSTQENKSHKSTSHVAPCTTAGGAGAGEPMAQNLNTANTAQPLDSSGFGGNAAAGGSSNLNMGSGMGAPQDQQGKAPAQVLGQGQGQGQGQGEYTTPRQKYNADADRPVQQQQHIARDQRGGF